MKCLFIILSCCISNAFAQDVIFIYGEKEIDVMIVEANAENIKYKSLQNPDGPTYTVARTNIYSIIFQDGSVQDLRNAPPSSQLSIEEVKPLILENINNYVFDAKSATRPYKASFEGDYLKLWIMRSRGNEPYNQPVLFDFSRAYDFQDISYRVNEAFINIFVGFVNKRGQVEKEKLVLRVLEKEKADELVTLLKIYNRLLSEKNIGASK